MVDANVHKVQLFQPDSVQLSIQCLAHELVKHHLAVGRSNGSIEIWNTQYHFLLEHVFFGDKQHSVEAVQWCRGRLFSSGFSGFIREHSIGRQAPVNAILVSSSPVWCLASSSTNQLAVGNEDGCITIVHVLDTSLEISQSLVKADSRILSLCWCHDNADELVSGSVDWIGIWSVASGRCLRRLTVRRETKATETLVWDGTLVSGDSTGRTSFWHRRTGTLASSFQSHRADVLSLCTDATQNCVYAAGIDPLICKFSLIESQVARQDNAGGAAEPRLRWSESIGIRVHEHDVRALCMAGSWVVSGSVDTFLGANRYYEKRNNVLRFPPFQRHRFAVASEAEMIMFQYDTYVELWKMGKAVERSQGEKSVDGRALPLQERPLKLIQLRSKHNSTIVCSAINETATYLAYSNLEATKLFRLSTDGAISAELVTFLDGPQTGCCWLAIQRNSFHLLTNEDVLVEFHLDKLLAKKVREYRLPGCVNATCTPKFSKKGKHFACALVDYNVIVVNTHSLNVITLPKVGSLPIALDFSSDQILVVLYANGELKEFNFVHGVYTAWQKEALSKDFKRISVGDLPLQAVRVLSDNLIAVYSSQALILLHRQKGTENEQCKLWHKNLRRYEHLCCVEILDNGEWIIVQVVPQRYLSSLPPPIKIKKFGLG